MDEKIAGEMSEKLVRHFGEDIAQSVMLKLLSLPEPPRNLEHYAFRAAKRLRVDEWRKTQTRPELPVLPGADVMHAEQERRAVARQTLERTDARLVLRAVNGGAFSNTERTLKRRGGMSRKKRVAVAAALVLLGLPQMAVPMI